MMTHHAGGMLSDSVAGLRQQQEWGIAGDCGFWAK